MNIIKKEELRKEFIELTQVQNLSIDEATNKLYEKINSDDYVLIGFNGIYVYMGTYKLVHESPTAWYPVNEVFVSEDDVTGEYKLFYELDTGLSKSVNIGNELDNFKENNIVIHIPNNRSYENKFTFEQDFEKIRKTYLKELCTKNEETATSLIIDDNYIKELFSLENYMKENNINPIFYQIYYDAALCNKKNKTNEIVLKKTNNK